MVVGRGSQGDGEMSEIHNAAMVMIAIFIGVYVLETMYQNRK